ncbi:hypothetical protein [Marisediminicola senii]|uniref:hypothetical protein n=1 Tax=Marisediminicola senii TaxID=2711233 RepID=UPI0013EC6DA1|nr:hypothetical protein [Marisediminicola senii]
MTLRTDAALAPAPAKLGACTINRCDEPARWLVTVAGHPNVKGTLSNGYCTEHANRVFLWDESPAVYSTTVTGPHPA